MFNGTGRLLCATVATFLCGICTTNLLEMAQCKDGVCDELSSSPATETSKTFTIATNSLEDPSGARETDCEAVAAGVKPRLGVESGRCTLRGAILLANTFPTHASITIMLPAGTIRLTSTLPEVRGKLAIAGFEPLPELGSMDENLIKRSDKVISPEVTRPTVINGRRKQILRTAPGSALLLRMLDIVNGMASDQLPAGKVAGTDIDSLHAVARGASGGAVHSLGELVADNVGFRRNTGVNGGAIYFEGVHAEFYYSVFQQNAARKCGGAVYVAGAARVTFEHSDISHNRDNCRTKTDGLNLTGMKTPGFASYLGLEWMWRSKETSPPPDPKLAQTSAPPPPVDFSGAVAKGPTLLPRD